MYSYVSNWRRDCHFTWSSEPREGSLAAYSAKGVLSFISYLKTLSIGPAPGIEPATSRALQSSALPTELILPRSKHWSVCGFFFKLMDNCLLLSLVSTWNLSMRWCEEWRRNTERNWSNLTRCRNKPSKTGTGYFSKANSACVTDVI